MKNVAFHGLMQMKDDYPYYEFSLPHLYIYSILKRLGESIVYTLWTWEWKRLTTTTVHKSTYYRTGNGQST